MLVTLRVLDDAAPGALRARLPGDCAKGAKRPGFRVVHYSVQDDHAHFLVEASGARRLANGMKSLAARSRAARTGCSAAGGAFWRFHHVLKRTPTEVRRALAYVLLNARKHYRQRRRRTPPVVLDGASSGLWFDGWKGRGPPPGRYADADRAAEVAAPRTWLLSKGWRRIGLMDPAEVPGR